MAGRPRLRLKAARVFVTDFDRAYGFYWQTLGLDVIACHREAGFALFDTGEARLIVEAIDQRSPDERGLVGRFLGFALAVEDLDAAHRELASRGVEFLVAPRPQPWAGRLAHLFDPDRNVLTLVE